MSEQHGGDALKGGHEGIDIGAGVVDSERSAHGAFDAQRVHQRLGAVVAGAHLDAELVEHQPHVVVVGAAQ